MQVVRIPKRKGEYRTIYVPSPEEKRSLTALLPLLNKLSMKCLFAHGFMIGRSAVTNALAHKNFRFTLCFDLKDFFDTVTPAHVAGKLPPLIIGQVFVDGAARQGLPTSPAVANLAAYDMDIRLNRLQKKHSISFVYTRYADDLSFSFNDLAIKDILLCEVPKLVSRFKFTINERKTEFQDASARRRHITGVGVDEVGIYPTRDAKRRLRAAIHQDNKPQAVGLNEWCKLKMPAIRNPRKMTDRQVHQTAYTLFATETLNPGQFETQITDGSYRGNIKPIRRTYNEVGRKKRIRARKKRLAAQKANAI